MSKTVLYPITVPEGKYCWEYNPSYGTDEECGEVWRQVKEMQLSFEHDHICIRTRTGFLLWQCKGNELNLYGVDLADILKAASINMPPDA